MSAAAQLGAVRSISSAERASSPLTPEMKEFIDRAIVPVLLKMYVEGNRLAESEESVAESVSSTALDHEKGVRP